MLAAGFKQLVKDARLELKVYDINQMSRLFNLKGGAKVGAPRLLLHASDAWAGLGPVPLGLSSPMPHLRHQAVAARLGGVGGPAGQQRALARGSSRPPLPPPSSRYCPSTLPDTIAHPCTTHGVRRALSPR